MIDRSNERTSVQSLADSCSDPSVRAFGAHGNGHDDDTQSFAVTLDRMGEAFVPAGRYKVSAIGPVEFQKPIYLHGTGARSVIELFQNVRPALRIAAVGGAFGNVRAPTIIEKMIFKRANTANAISWLTAIELHSVHTYKLENLVLIGLGPEAIRIKSCYYGSITSLSLANSGLTLLDVNNCSIISSDIRPDDFNDDSRGANIFAKGTYPLALIDSTKTTFLSTVIEGWHCPVILLRRSSNTVFSSCWIEGLRSPSHVIRCENVSSLEIINSWVDFSLPYGDCFIEIDNSAAVVLSDRMRVTNINIVGGTLTATGRSFGDAGKLIRAVNHENVRVRIDALTFRGGRLYADQSVKFDVRSITLSGQFRHFITSIPNARVDSEKNSWMMGSKYRNWNFDIIDITSSEDITIETTNKIGEFATGSNAMKISGLVPRRIGTMRHDTRGNLEPIKQEGESYVIFVRLKSSKTIEIKLEINGGYEDFSNNPFITLAADEWVDILFKTQEDVSWAQGRFESPHIIFYMNNVSDENAILYLDRIDYVSTMGDFVI